jgi:hypothetical protein
MKPDIYVVNELDMLGASHSKGRLLDYHKLGSKSSFGSEAEKKF